MVAPGVAQPMLTLSGESYVASAGLKVGVATVSAGSSGTAAAGGAAVASQATPRATIVRVLVRSSPSYVSRFRTRYRARAPKIRFGAQAASEGGRRAVLPSVSKTVRHAQ